MGKWLMGPCRCSSQMAVPVGFQHKQYMGGYRNKKSEVQYHHAVAQTDPKKREPKPKVCRVRVVHASSGVCSCQRTTQVPLKLIRHKKIKHPTQILAPVRVKTLHSSVYFCSRHATVVIHRQQAYHVPNRASGRHGHRWYVPCIHP